MSRYVVDSSALVKLLVLEEHSGPAWALLQGAECVCSALVLVEVPRVLARRSQAGWQDGWRRMRPGLRVVDLGRPVMERAAALRPAGLRTLDALHLATALLVGLTDGLVAYDLRLLDAATGAGLHVLHPGLVRP